MSSVHELLGTISTNIKPSFGDYFNYSFSFGAIKPPSIVFPDPVWAQLVGPMVTQTTTLGIKSQLGYA